MNGEINGDVRWPDLKSIKWMSESVCRVGRRMRFSLDDFEKKSKAINLIVIISAWTLPICVE